MPTRSVRRPAVAALALLLVFAAAACDRLNPQPATSTPAVFPTPTRLTPGPDVTATSPEVTPGVTAAPATSTAVPTETASADATASATGSPAAPGGSATPSTEVPEAILILVPGAGAPVASPVRVTGEADPTFEQNVVVQVTGVDGTVLATVPTTLQAEAGQRGPFAVDVPFSVPADQAGRISVYDASPRDGGLVHLASVEVTLLASGGAAQPSPDERHGEQLRLDTPAPLATVSGGTLHLTGFSEYVFENSLVVVLCGEGGSGAPDPVCGTADNVVATGTARVESPDVGQPGPFTADLAYTVSGPVQGRLAVYHTSPRDGGLLHLTSVPVRLQP